MDRIQSYLDGLGKQLRLAPGQTERLLEETGAHLQDAADAHEAAGLTREEAELKAIDQFGTVGEVARAANGGLVATAGRLSLAAAQLAAAVSTTVLAGIVLARLVARVTSTGWVYGLPSRATPTASTIAHWLQVQPSATSWRDAGALENASDSLVLRGGFAALVLLASVAFVLVARRRVGRLERRVVPAAGLAAFACATVFLVLGGVTQAFGLVEWGRGQWFCDAAVALLAALAYAARSLQLLQRTTS